MPTIITPAALQTSAKKYRRELLTMPAQGLRRSLQHMTLRTGLRAGEVVGQLTADLQLGPYSSSRKDTSDIAIKGRELETFFGSVIKDFDPNSVVQTIYGADATKGDALKNVPITLQVISYLAVRLGFNLQKVLWSAVRNAGGTTSAALFNGFDTITASEITAGTIAAANGNYEALAEAITSNNAVDILKSICANADEELTDECKMFVAPAIYRAYLEDYKATTGAAPYNTEYKKTFVEGFDGVELVPLSNKKDSQYIHLSPKQNMLVGMNREGEEEQIQVDRFSSFELTFSASMFFGVQFESISKERLYVAKLHA